MKVAYLLRRLLGLALLLLRLLLGRLLRLRLLTLLRLLDRLGLLLLLQVVPLTLGERFHRGRIERRRTLLVAGFEHIFRHRLEEGSPGSKHCVRVHYGQRRRPDVSAFVWA